MMDLTRDTAKLLVEALIAFAILAILLTVLTNTQNMVGRMGP